jgi:hypothetical protein
MSSVFQRRRNSRWNQDEANNGTTTGNPSGNTGLGTANPNPNLNAGNPGPQLPVTILARRNTNDNMFPPGGARNVNAPGTTASVGAGAGTGVAGIGGGVGGTNDSLTLGQLKAAAAALPKEKVRPWTEWEYGLMG